MINNSCIEIFVQDVTPIPLNSKELEAEEKPQKSLNEKQQVCYLLATLFAPSYPSKESYARFLV